jgi:hypothetical protein
MGVVFVAALIPGQASAARARLVAGLTVSPQPGTPDASPTTQISLLGLPASRILAVRARGTRSGLHRGRLRAYSSGGGASFVPGHRFSQGEVVSVRVTTASGSRHRHGLFRFRVGGHADLGMPPGPAPPTSPRSAQRFVSRPDLYAPSMTITERRAGRAPGDLFVSTILAPGHVPPVRGQIGPMIFDDQGELVWLSPSPSGREAFNFRVQRYRGAPVLTWWQGRLSFLGLGFGENVIADSSYHVIARVRAGNGYHADLHEFTIDDRDSGWVTIYVPVLVRFQGRRVAVLDSIVQRVDIPTGLVMFEWHSLGHIGLRESYVKPPPKSRLPLDAFHVNSIQVDRSGNLLLSNRNTWAVYKVSGRTGRILWRLGGKRSNFRLSRHARFAWQHDAQVQPDGTVTLFDDEAAPRAGRESRGITLALGRRRARLVRSYTNRRHLLAGSQGNMQVLPAGNVLVGWGAKPYLSEYSQDHHLLFEARFPRGDESYRAYRFDWVGRPDTAPAVAVRVRAGQLTAYASWNGATEVASWRVLAGAAPDALAVAAVAPRSGFETAIPAPGGAQYVAVQALDAGGQVLGSSVAAKAS